MSVLSRITAIIGSSGDGKSTLLRTLNRMGDQAQVTRGRRCAAGWRKYLRADLNAIV